MEVKGLEVKGECRFISEDVETGKVVDHGTFGNLVTNLFYDSMVYANTSGNNDAIGKILFGSGTVEPRPSDTQMTSLLFSYGGNSGDEKSITIDINADGSITKTFIWVVPASSNYVGTISEVGLANNSSSTSSGLFTHLLLKDINGDITPIVKTSTMKLSVYYALTFIFDDSATAKFQKASCLYNGYRVPTIGIGVGQPYDIGIGIAYQAKDCIRIINGRPVLQIIKPAGLVSMNNTTTSNARKSWDSTTKQGIFRNSRLLSDQLNTRYVKSLILRGESQSYAECLGVYITFPNPTLFPLQTLTNMSVGVGDGVTDDFTPPLNFWVKDTDEIYIDGIRQIRGVDYTCDYYNNLSNLASLLPSSQAITNDGEITTDGYYHLFQKFTSNDSSLTEPSNSRKNNLKISPSLTKPLIVEFPFEEDESIDWSIDRWNIYNYYANSASRPTRMNIYSSDDKTTWGFVGEYVLAASGTSTVVTVSFPEQKKRYWKFEPTIIAGGDYTYYPIQMTCRRTGRPIHFTTPPPEGAVITMNAAIDRPLKNANYVIDFNPVIQSRSVGR